MKGFQIKIEGNWAHFKKPETNNNPLTHDLITKTALIGMIGAVLGIEREQMRAKFPKLSEDLLYGVELLRPMKKVSWGFTSRTAISPTASGSPKYFEFLQNPGFKVSLALKSENTNNEFGDFLHAIKEGESIYTPVLGWHNCPANLEYISEGSFSSRKEGVFETKGFAEPQKHNIEITDTNFRIGFDKLPTFQDDSFWNKPEFYRNVIYPDFPNSVKLKGEYYEYQSNGKPQEQWWLM